MAARLTDKQKKKIVADYLENESYRATARLNGVSDGTVKRIVQECGDFEQKSAEKKEQNTNEIIAYMESKRDAVCDIIGIGLEVLRSSDKLSEASPAQITTAIGTLIDKWAMISAAHGPADKLEDDELSKSLKEMAKELESDE